MSRIDKTIECQLTYLQEDDSILCIHGMNADYNGRPFATIELKVAEYALVTLRYRMETSQRFN